MKGLDLSKFKKMASDGKSTTLKHPEGHKIVIAHASLSPSMKKQLEAIPKKYADGGDVEESDFSRDAKDAYKQVFGEPAKEEQSGQDFASRYNAPVNAPQAAADTKLKITPEERAGMDSVRAQEGPLPSDTAPEPEVAAQEPAPPVIPQGTLAPASERVPAAVEPSPAMAEPTQAAAAPETLAPAPQPKTYEQSFNEYKQAHQKEFAEQDAAFAQDLNNGHITPMTYHDLYAKKDTLGKIGTLFGLLLSGAGSGLSGQPNAVLEGMNQEIKNDLEAQTKSKENAQNFIKLNQFQQLQNANIENLKKSGALTDAQAKQIQVESGTKAFALANIQANQAAFHNQAQMVAKLPEGPQKEQAKAALAMMGTAMSTENAKIGDLASSKLALLNSINGGQGGMNGTALRMMGQPEMAKDIEEKTVPGLQGHAQIPIPQDTRDRLAAQKQYDEKAREYVNFAKQHSKNWANLNLADRQRVANQGGAMAANLQSLYRNKIKGGVYKKGEQEFIEQIIPDQPAKWSASLNAIPKVEQTIRDNTNDLKNTAGSVGLKYESPQSGGGGAQEGSTSTSKSGKPIIYTNGKWHYK